MMHGFVDRNAVNDEDRHSNKESSDSASGIETESEDEVFRCFFHAYRLFYASSMAVRKAKPLAVFPSTQQQ